MRRAASAANFHFHPERSIQVNRLLSSTLVLIVPALLLAGCGDGSSGSSGGGGAGGSTATGGSGGSTATGGSTSSGGSGGMTSTGGTGGAGGTTASGACTNAADLAVIQDPAKDIQGGVGTCAKDNLAAEPATLDCIKGLGLSAECAACFDGTVQCIFMNCLNDCLADQNSQACIDCRAMNCDPEFAMCSGLTP